jgi:hypothetical protein
MGRPLERLARWRRERAAALLGCASEVGIPSDEGDRLAGGQGARQMNRVVAAQGEPFGELSCVARELCVDGYSGELALDRLELGQRALVRRRGEASRAPRRPKSSATLGVGEDARRSGVRARP